MSAFNPFAVIEGGLQAGKEYREGRAMDDILKQSRQAKSPEDQLNIMGQVLQRLPADQRAEANEYLKERYRLSQIQGASDEVKREGGIPVPPAGRPSQQSDALGPRGESIKVEDDFLSGATPAVSELTARLMIENPIRFRDPVVAAAEAEKRIAREKVVLSDTEKAFRDSLTTGIEKSEGKESFIDIPGEVQQKFLRQAQNEAKTGKISPESAGDKAAIKLVDLAKARTTLKEMTGPSLFNLKSGKTAQAQLNSIRKTFKDVGELELFKNDLMSKEGQGLTNGVASLVAFPPSDNPKIGSFIKDTKAKPSFGLKGPRLKTKGSKIRSTDEIVEFISDNLGKKDSINAFLAAFNGLGYDAEEIRTGIENSPKISLDKRQQREIDQRPNFSRLYPNLSDIFFFAATGLNIGEIVNE